MLKRKKSSALDHPLQNHPAATCASSQATACTVHKGLPVGSILPPPPALPVESEGYTVTPWFIWKSPLWMKRKIILKSNRFMTFQNVEKKIWGVSKAHFEIFVQLRLGSCLNTVTIKNGFPSLDCWFPGCCCGSQESTVGDPTPTLVDPKLTTDLGRNKPANNRCIQ